MADFRPSRAFVGSTVKSQIASENDPRVGWIYCEHLEADVPVVVGAAVGTDRWLRRGVIVTNLRSPRATSRDLDPSRPAVCRFIQIMLGVLGSQKVKRGASPIR